MGVRVLRLAAALVTIPWVVDCGGTYWPEPAGDPCQIYAHGRLDGDDRLVLVGKNSDRRMRADYQPADLVEMDREFMAPGFPRARMRAEAWTHLRQLLVEARAANLPIRVRTAYRSFAAQCAIYRNHDPATRAAVSAKPGASQHQLGTAVDLAIPDNDFALDDAMAGSRQAAWLKDNAAGHGFVLSYPPGNDSYVHEPWHYRYVGVEAAAEVIASGLTLDDFLRRPRSLRFDHRCTPSQAQVTVALTGDILLHATLQQQAFTHPRGARSLWETMEPALAKADLVWGNLEGPVAENLDCRSNRVAAPALEPGDCRVDERSVYTGFPSLNYHPTVVRDLVASGFDIVSTANNHALDRGVAGLDLTIDALRRYRLRFTGTRHSVRGGEWVQRTTVNGVALAWLGCTTVTNVGGHRDLLLRCRAPEVVESIRRLRADPTVDAIIVTPHWGQEFGVRPRRWQAQLADRWIGEGVLAVIGAHAHVLQSWERVRVNGHEGFVIYSLANFVSNQIDTQYRDDGTPFFDGDQTRPSLILYLSIHKAGRSTWIDRVMFQPAFMTRDRLDRSRVLLPLDGPPDPADAHATAALAFIAARFPMADAVALPDPLPGRATDCP